MPEKTRALEHDTRRTLTALEILISGAIAGATAKSIIAPADRVKILYQINPSRQFSLGAAFRTGRTIFQNSGVFGLFRGHAATLLKVCPYAATTYFTFDRYKENLKWAVPNLDPISTRLIAGSLAGATAVTLTYPFDLFRTRMAAHWGTTTVYTTYGAAIKEVIATEGFRGLYKGLSPSLVGIMPYAGINFTVFETLKSYSVAWRIVENEKEISTPMRLVFGGTAGLVAQSITYPLDTVRRRMQLQGSRVANSEFPAYKGVLDAFVTIYRSEGLKRGLYKGLSMNWVKGPVAVAVSFTVNDHLREYMRRGKQN